MIYDPLLEAQGACTWSCRCICCAAPRSRICHQCLTNSISSQDSLVTLVPDKDFEGVKHRFLLYPKTIYLIFRYSNLCHILLTTIEILSNFLFLSERSTFLVYTPKYCIVSNTSFILFWNLGNSYYSVMLDNCSSV